MNLEQLKTHLAFITGFKAGRPGQDFTGPSADVWRRMRDALNAAALDEYGELKSSAPADVWLGSMFATWAADSRTFVIPAPIDPSGLIAIYDVTASDRGIRIDVHESGVLATITWGDRRTLVWGEDGPGDNRSLRLDYTVMPVELVNDADAPEWLPPECHWLLVWSAAIWLRTVADERAPQAWVDKRGELRDNTLKLLSRPRPQMHPQRRVLDALT